MIDPRDERRAPPSPQMAMRVAILGGIALALFAIVFFRLWSLQVLSGDQYLAQASSNRVRSVAIAAPRGELIDRNGKPLVENRRAIAVVVSPTALPRGPAPRERLLVRLSEVLGKSTRRGGCEFGIAPHVVVKRLMPVDCMVQQHVSALPYADVTVEPDAPPDVTRYLAERADRFPGVAIRQVFVRSYPYRSLAAHLFGTIGQIDADGLRSDHYRGVNGGTIVGKSGLEYQYDRYLRGVDGAERIQVDALGHARRGLPDRTPVAGANLRVSLDSRLQRAGERALEVGIEQGRAAGNAPTGGAFVALDPRSGAVLAMGSNPTFDPNDFTRPQSKRVYDAKYGGDEHRQLNRAAVGEYAIGSTFKPVTAAAALAAGTVTEDEVYVDTGTWQLGEQRRHNAGRAVYGPVSMRKALAVSVDTYFYTLGQRVDADPATHPRGGALQQWARAFGFGAPTGIDLPDDASGRVPDPRWRAQVGRDEARCRRRRHVASCGYGDMRPWTTGDNVSLAVGQGDFLATPLQLAVAYAAIANGGTVVRPHVGLDVTDARGLVRQHLPTPPARRIEIPGLATIRAGLLDSTSTTDGTSSDVFRGFPYHVYGKTGTAQKLSDEPDQSWYVAYVDDPRRPPIVVAAVIEDGGFGAQAAAPAVRWILSAWLGVPQHVVSGRSPTA